LPRELVVGVEIENNAVRPVEARRARSPRMHLDDAPLHQSCERCRGIGAKVGCLPLAFAYVNTRHCPVDGTVRVLLIKTLPAPAVRATHEAERSTFDVRQQM